MLPETRCLDEDEVLGLLGGGAGERARTHLDQCSSCLELVALVGRTTQGSLAQGTPAGAAEAPFVEAGTQVGRYRIERLLGRGGMGVVYAAHDPELGRQVALKLVRADLAAAGGGRIALRLLREAQALADFSHPNVLTVYDVGTHQGSPFMAAELVEGETLAAWMGREHAWRDAVALLLQAGRGLAAAHAAGLVHRDFKPQNAIVGADGRVRVIDFGLVRLPGEVAAEIVGTPRYMAPEQRRGGDADARSDQYSFCAAFEEALRRTRGEPAPRWLVRLITRGLAEDAAARHASMTALLDAIETGLRRRARRRAVAAAAALAMTVAAGGVWAGRESGSVAPCSGAAAALGDAWSPARQAAVARAIAGSEAPHAADTWQALRRQLDDYAAGWVQAHEGACVATRIDGVQSEALLDRRMVCLERRRLSLDAATAELAAGVEIGRVLAVADGVPPVEDCDAAAVARREPPPAPPADRPAVAEVRAGVARAIAALRAGSPERALDLAEAATAAADATGHEPARAEARVVLGMARRTAGDTAGAIRALEEAVWAAEASEHDRAVAEGALELAYVIGSVQARPEDATFWRRLAEAAVRRLGDPRLDCKAERIAGRRAQQLGELARARAHLETAVARCQEGFGGESRHVAATLGLLGLVEAAEGERDAAEAAHRRALSIVRAAVGAHHPDTAEALRNLGAHLAAQDRLDEAGELYRRALEIEERALGPAHPSLGRTLNNLAEVGFRTGDLEGARGFLERALAIKRASLGPEHPELGSTLMNLGDVARALGDGAAAARHYREALRVRELGLPADHPAIARARSRVAELAP